MVTRAEQANLYNEAIAQGLPEDEALAAAGITNPDEFTYGFDTGKLEPAVLGPPRRENETIVPPGSIIDDGDDDEDRQFRTSPVSSETTTTSQTTVTGGSVRTTRVTPTTYRDTAESSALSSQANSLSAQKEARAAELRAQGKTGAEVIRDPEYRRLSREAQATEYAAQDARAVDQAGTISVTTEPGSGQVFQQTPSSQLLTNDTAGDDPQINVEDANRFSTSGELPRNFAAGDVTDTGGAPTQSLTDIEDPGFVPVQEPSAVPPGFSPYGEEDDPFDPDLALRDPTQDEFENELEQARLAQERENLDFARSQAVDTGGVPAEVNPEVNPQVPQGVPFDDDGNLSPGWTLDGDGEPIFIGGDFVDPSLTASAEASRAAAAADQARVALLRTQATLEAQRKQASDGDWRVKLRLAPDADYLYKDPEISETGILYPLAVTNGVVFPYTPNIVSSYNAKYNPYDLTHSNYRGYFYQGSHVGDVQINATFTAQDTSEANYLLAVIHFFKSVTKMFYGKDAQRGAPPPLVFIQGLGQFQYNLQPCVVSQFNYNLPAEVDYIRARTTNQALTENLLFRRDRQTLPTNPFSSGLDRLRNAGLKKGALNNVPPSVPTLGTNTPTYVPTKIEMTITLLPMQTRQQVSQQFSLKQFANGDLIEGGFW